MTPSTRNAAARLALVLATATLPAACQRASADYEAKSAVTDVALSPDGIPIAYTVSGDGAPALVFVHGWLCDRTYWRGQLEPFSKDHKVVAIDLAGHGESGRGTRSAFTMQSFGGDVAAVVEKLDLKRVILIGHSLAGNVTIEAARRLPGRVSGLVWVDSHWQFTTFRKPEQIEAMVAGFRPDFVGRATEFVRGMFLPNADTALRELVVRDMSSAPPEVVLSALTEKLKYDGEVPQALKELRLPVVAINRGSPPSDTASLQANGVDVIQVPGVGHFFMMEDPDRFNGILRTALARLVR